MLAKTIEYTDYNGVNRKETFYFHLSKAEIAERELSTVGGLQDSIQKIIEAKDVPQLVRIFKQLILDTYGEKSADGKRFIKSKELSEAFSQTEAYSILFMELATDEKAAADFINGISPVDISDKIEIVDGKVEIKDKELADKLSI